MIGKKILELRKKNNLSQEELAEVVGVSRQTISNWELDETAPDLKQIQKLVSVFNFSVDELIGNENVLLKKVNNTENNSRLIIKLVKTVGITLGVLLFLLLIFVGSSLFITNYYSAEPSGYGAGKICYYKGEIKNYTIMKSNATNELSYSFIDDEITAKFNLDDYKGTEPDILLNDVVKYIKENGGICLEE